MFYKVRSFANDFQNLASAHGFAGIVSAGASVEKIKAPSLNWFSREDSQLLDLIGAEIALYKKLSMIVRKLNWLSKIAKEAELVISDGKYKCIAFSHPCEVKEGDNLKEPLHAFIVNDLMLSTEKICSVYQLHQVVQQQHVVAEVINTKNNLVKVGNIKIILEEKIPHGVLPGDLIEFNCSRLDVW